MSSSLRRIVPATSLEKYFNHRRLQRRMMMPIGRMGGMNKPAVNAAAFTVDMDWDHSARGRRPMHTFAGGRQLAIKVGFAAFAWRR